MSERPAADDDADALGLRALQLQYALHTMRHREAARLRADARTLHACASSVAALHADVCRLQKRVQRRARARRFLRAYGRLLRLAESPGVVAEAAEHAETLAGAVGKASSVVPCADDLEQGLAAAQDTLAAAVGTEDTRTACVQALRDLAGAIRRVRACESALAEHNKEAKCSTEALQQLRTRMRYLEICKELLLPQQQLSEQD